MPSVSQKAIWTVYFVMLMDTLNFGIVFPLLPSIAKDFDASAEMVGSMASIYSFCQMLATPVLGRISDRFGRRPVIIWSILGTSVSSLATGFAWTFPLVIAARCINGISGATVGVVNAYIADITTPDERPDYLSYMSASNSLGVILGPALGGFLAQQGFAFACYVSAALSGLNLLFALALITESRWVQAGDSALLSSEGEVVRGKGEGKGKGKGKTFADEPPNGAPAKIPCAAGLLYAAGFLMIMGFASVESITGYYLMDTFFNGDQTASAQFFGTSMMVNGVVMFIFTGLCYRRLRACMGENVLLAIGVLLRALSFSSQALAPSKWIFTMGWTGVVLGTQCVVPSTSSLLTTMCARSIYGRALGYQQSAQAFARVLAPMSFGWLYTKTDHRCSFVICSASTLLAGIFIALVPRVKARQPRLTAVTRDDVEANVRVQETQEQLNVDSDLDISPMARKLTRTFYLDS
eukprot:TRINITY_DN37223_c0_g1_i2.p1 TRINITY_DN37223_c0_g1~~TRINITY_DN37223_c0_g1_i2.p1  ORF type:complete len:466 (-),score=62.53 TRINITY_DN37223_c0_g1_i2:44-1441(-)